MVKSCRSVQFLSLTAVYLALSVSLQLSEARALDLSSLNTKVAKNQTKFQTSYKKALTKLFESNKKVLDKANSKGIPGLCVLHKADLNMDGKVDDFDLGILSACSLAAGSGICKAADLNSDFKVDQADLDLIGLAISSAGSTLCSKVLEIPTPSPTVEASPIPSATVAPVPPVATATPIA